MARKKKEDDEYRFAFEIRNEKAHIIVYEPIITKEEQEKRMKELKDAVKEFWESYYRQKAIEARDKMRGGKSRV